METGARLRFLDPRPCQRFFDFLRERGVEPIRRDDRPTRELAIAVGTEANPLLVIERRCDEMTAFNQVLFEVDGQAAGRQRPGMVRNLADAVKMPDQRPLCER